jgi:hypothetical protein
MPQGPNRSTTVIGEDYLGRLPSVVSAVPRFEALQFVLKFRHKLIDL